MAEPSKSLKVIGALSMTVMGVVAMFTNESRLVGYLCVLVGVFGLVHDLAPKFWKRLRGD